MAGTIGRLNLKRIDATDLVDVSVFNANFTTLDSKLANSYVTGASTANNWRYRKWSANWLELWYDDRAFEGTYQSVSNGPLFVSPTFSFPSYSGGTFSARPQVHVALASVGAASDITRGWVELESSTSLTVPPKFRLVSDQSGILAYPRFCIYATGRCK